MSGLCKILLTYIFRTQELDSVMALHSRMEGRVGLVGKATAIYCCTDTELHHHIWKLLVEGAIYEVQNESPAQTMMSTDQEHRVSLIPHGKPNRPRNLLVFRVLGIL